MSATIFTYLRKSIPTDTATINRLFVSFFLNCNYLQIIYGHWLYNYVIGSLDTKDYSLFKEFETRLNHSITHTITLEDIVKLFEFVISPSDRIINGAIYTPKRIRTVIIEECLGKYSPEQLRNIEVCDIACGCGGFLMDVAEYLHEKTGKSFRDIFRDNIYGIDIQDYSIERAKILLSLLALTHGEDCDFEFNLLNADTLDFCSEGWNKKYSSFDVIVGNPPYVCSRNVSEQTKAKMLRYEVSQSGHPDLYIPFFQIADEMLKDGGVLGYITMNSFIRSVNGRKLREYFSSKRRDISIIDFRGRQIFEKKSTYTCLFFLHKGSTVDEIKYITDEKGELRLPFDFKMIPYSSLDNKMGWNMNENSETNRIESIGTPIGKYCSSRHGIATLSNKTYIFKPQSEDGQYYYIKSDSADFKIEKSICRDIVNSNKLNSNVDFSSIIEKVIFPYFRNNEGKSTIINEEELQHTCPGAYQYLQSKKTLLAGRDKGNTQDYPAWYAYGRTQSLQMPRYKLFFPKFANSEIRCMLVDDPNLLLYNGMAFVSDDRARLLIVQKIIESKVFWRYIVNNAKPYSSDYYSLSGVDIKNFGVPNFSEQEIDKLLAFESRDDVNDWLQKVYKYNQFQLSCGE